jgi:Mn-dependent DtxR family transcriptional regulator
LTTKNKESLIGKIVDSDESVYLDLQRLLDERLLLQANSGGGKSYAVRKLCEITHGKVQQIIIDPEGEFATLREKYDYILVGKDGDIPINLRSAELLARKLLELGTSAIIDLYELKHNERKRFVKLFLDSLMNAPKSLWHPCIVVIDEAHVFAPESSHGQAESLDSVKDLATRGRKRGFALVAATQRLSKMSKDVVAELNTKLIGRSSLDVDMKRAGYELGFTSKEDIFSLRKLEKGEFYAFGGALTSEVTKIKIGLCQTTHPQAGKTYQTQGIASSEKIKSVLSKLGDLPKEAESELKTKEDMQKKIISLKRDVISAKRTQTVKEKPVIDQESIKKAEQRGFKQAEIQYMKNTKLLESQLTKFRKIVEQIHSSTSNALEIKITKIDPIPITIPIANSIPKQIVTNPTITNEISDISSELTNSETKVLKAIVQRPDYKATRKQTAVMVGYSPKSGSYKNICSHLRSMGYVDYQGDYLAATQQGIDQCHDVEPLPTDPDSIQNFWYSKVTNSESKLLKIIVGAYPNTISREEIAMQAEYSPTSGSFKNMLSHLRSTGLIDYEGKEVKATEEMFPLI